MLNILIPLAGKSRFFEESEQSWPKPLLEVNGIPMIEYSIWSMAQIQREKRFIFIINEKDAARYYLDRTLRLLTDESTAIVIQKGNAQGAPCSCLMAVDEIKDSEPLIIANGDQFLIHNLTRALNYFDEKNADGGVVNFDSVHPQWSYAYCDDDRRIWETAEKKPISRRAIAGVYYFRKGADFVENAKAMIEKDVRVGEMFYTSLIFNELILQGKRVFSYGIENEDFYSFYSVAKIKEFEKRYQFKKLDHFLERVAP